MKSFDIVYKMRVRLTPIIVLLSASLVVASKTAQGCRKVTPPSAKAFARRWLKDTRSRIGAPGLTVVLIRDGEIAAAEADGVADIETHQPMTVTTLAHIGSVTKSFTATAVLALAHQNRLDLDAPVGKYLPQLQPPISELTPRQLLSHTAGLKDVGGTLDISLFGPHDDEVVEGLLSTWDQRLIFSPPGQIFSYSSYGYALLGALISSVTKQPYPEAMVQLVFHPLGMEHSMFRATEAMTYPLSQAHVIRNSNATVFRPYTENSQFWPAGFMFSTSEDLAKWVKWFLGEGGDQLRLDRSIPFDMQQIPKSKYGIPESQYGLGLEYGKLGRVAVVGHVGNLPGATTYLRIVPERRIAVIAHANVDQADLDAATDRALRFLWGCPQPPETLNSRIPRSFQHSLESFVGRYEGNSELSIQLRDGHLIWVADQNDKFASPQLKAGMPLERIGEYRFARCRPGDVFFVFGNGLQPEFVLLHDTAYRRKD